MKTTTSLILRIAIILSLAICSTAQADTLSTGTLSNNGTGGVFMNLTSIGGSDLMIEAFDTQLAGTIEASIEVWTRPSSYVGFEASNAGWTLQEVITGTGAGNTVNVPLSPLATSILVANGSPMAVYLHSVTTGAGIRYFGTGTTSTSNYNDANLALFTDRGRTGNVAFAGGSFSPRAFVGNIHYSVAIPEPSTLALVLLGGVFTICRRVGR